MYRCVYVNEIVFTQLWGTYHTIMRAGPVAAHRLLLVYRYTLYLIRRIVYRYTLYRTSRIVYRYTLCIAAVGHLPHHHAGGAGSRTLLAPSVPVHTLPLCGG